MTIWDPFILLSACFILLFVLLACGMKIAVILAMIGALGFFAYDGSSGLVFIVPFRILNSFILIAIPLFMFMGEILMKSEVSVKMYRGVSRLLSWAPGGLLHSNIGACALFASVSGSSPATAATIGTVAIPELQKRGYDRQLVLGSIAAGGTLGILIPPSMTMIVYGMLARTSVGALFIGGILPGIMLATMFMLYIVVKTIINPQLSPKERVSFSVKSLALSFIDLGPVIILGVIIMGGIFGGFLTPTEAAAVGAIVALVMALASRNFTWQHLWKSLWDAAQTSSMIFFIIVGASIMASFFARAGIPAAMSASVLGLDIPGIAILIIVYLLYIFLGCFLDPLSVMVLTIPTVLPIILNLGFDRLWFGVTLVVLIEMAMITPPVGLNLFVVQGISGESLFGVAKASIPFFFIMILCVVVLTISPPIITWLPSLMIT